MTKYKLIRCLYFLFNFCGQQLINNRTKALTVLSRGVDTWELGQTHIWIGGDTNIESHKVFTLGL